MDKPKKIIRTTLGEYLMDREAYDGSGVYVLACFPSLGCLYIGQSKHTHNRVRAHFQEYPSKQDLAMCTFINLVMLDALNFRLDILIPPMPNCNQWLYDVERELIQRQQPLFNTQYTR